MTSEALDRPEQDANDRAARLLVSLGWQHLSAAEVLLFRGGREDQSLLQLVLEQSLKRLNSFESFSVEFALEALIRNEQEELRYSSEKIWSLLKYGVRTAESPAADPNNTTIRYVDWENPHNNIFQFAQDFAVASANGVWHIDLVLFVNGIPWVAIEAKSARTKAEGSNRLSAAIGQLQSYQRPGHATQLFRYTQILLAACMREAAYGAAGADRQSWATWRESLQFPETIDEGAPEHELAPSKAQPLIANEQDRLIYALCRPVRLMDLVRTFTLFRSGRRIIARYYQHTAIQAVLAQVCKPEVDGRRPGGLVWHTQGTGKSLTMAMLAQVLLDKLQPRPSRVVLVTDRSALDEQLSFMLRESGIDYRHATSGRELRDLLRDPQARIITTVVQKFSAAMNTGALIADSPDIFVLVDEAHRTQSGQLHYAMRRMLPRACFIGFTGTPLSANDARTTDVFGDYLATYTLEQAIQDNNLLPVQWEVYKTQSVFLQDKEWSPLHAEMTERIRAVAQNVADHYKANLAGSSLKALLIASSRTAALQYKHSLDATASISSEVAISIDQDAPAEQDEIDPVGPASNLRKFREEVISQFGSAWKYEEDLLRRFRDTDDPKILIVVEKFLSGTDIPRLGALYIDKPLRDHSLLQTIARVNRPYPGKKRGRVVDYVGLIDDEARRDLAATIDIDYDNEESATIELNKTLGERLLESSTLSSIELPPADLETACRMILQEELAKANSVLAWQAVWHLAEQIAAKIYFNRKVEWIGDLDLQNKMKTLIEDEVFEVQSQEGVALPLESIDAILDRCVATARTLVP